MRNSYITSALAAGLTIMAFPAQAGNIGVDTEVSVKTAPSERVSKRIYEVRVDGDSNDSQREVFDEALYKAAKHTLKKEYDWFRIIDKETEKETTETRNSSGFSGHIERVPERHCGLLTCRTTYRTYHRTDVTANFPDRKKTVYTVILEYEMGSGPAMHSTNVYNARIVKNSYK